MPLGAQGPWEPLRGLPRGPKGPYSRLEHKIDLVNPETSQILTWPSWRAQTTTGID